MDVPSLVGLLKELPGPTRWGKRNYFLWRCKRWSSVERGAWQVKKELTSDSYLPTLIAPVGRGGAILGATLSGLLSSVPLWLNDRVYVWDGDKRTELNLVPDVAPPAELLSRVLITDGEMHSSRTLKYFRDHFLRHGATEVRTAVLYVQDPPEESEDALKPDYSVFSVPLKKGHRFWGRLPWKLSDTYRSPAYSREHWNRMRGEWDAHMSRFYRDQSVLIVRHAECEAGTGTERFVGTTESPLTQAGRRQAEATAAVLRHSGASQVYCSPLGRARDTANVIAARAGVECSIDKRLSEMDYGAWEGVERCVLERESAELYRAWVNDPEGTLPPGAETPASVEARVMDWWCESVVCRKHRPGDAIVVVTHKSVARILLCHMIGNELRSYRDIPMECGSITKITRRADGKVAINYQNCTDHLRGLATRAP